MTDQKFRGPPKFTIFGITPEGVAALRTGAKTLDAAKDEIWKQSKSYPTLVWRVFEADWKEVEMEDPS